MTQRVLVTGASGFLALHCIQQALAASYAVRATVRSFARESEVRNALPEACSRLEIVEADLSSDEGWSQAAQDCAYVLHVASPFPQVQPRNPDEVIRPARDGTLRVLSAARAAGVKRVVLTSSMNAVAGAAGKPAGYRYTDADWADPDHPRMSPYDRSKVIAEKAAWAFAKENSGLEVAVIIPGAILGPLLSPDASASADPVRLLLEGQVRAIPRIGFAPVDVRDVAAAHIAALAAPEAPGRRFITCLDHVWLEEVAAILRAEFAGQGFRIANRRLPDFVLRALATVNPTMRRAAHVLGHRRLVDTSPARTLLGWRPRTVPEMVIAMANSLVGHGLVSAPQASG